MCGALQEKEKVFDNLMDQTLEYIQYIQYIPPVSYTGQMGDAIDHIPCHISHHHPSPRRV